MRTLFTFLLVALLMPAPARAVVIYVDDTAPVPPAGANDGSSWDNAFLDLQGALATAKSDDEIRVGQGVYKPAPLGGSREATFNLVGGTILQGGYAGFGAKDPDALDPEQFETILSGDLNGDDGPSFENYDENSLHVVSANRLGSATMRGLTIASGNALPPEGMDDPVRGGGLHAIDSHLVLADCRFAGNRARYFGGGLYAEGGLISITRAHFAANRTGMLGWGAGLNATHCTIEDSHFENNAAHIGEGGGAVIGPGSRVQRCVFVDNGAERGGGLAIDNAVVIDSTFHSNGANIYGGGLRNLGQSVVLNCRFIGNSSGFCGGAVYNPTGALTLVNCMLTGNMSDHSGGAIRSNHDLTLRNCTIVGNSFHTSGMHGAGIFAAGTLTATNTTFWENTGSGLNYEAQQIELGSKTSATIANCCIMGWTGQLGGVGNHGNDPNFIDADGPDDDYGTEDDNPRLRANSPCIDTGDSSLLPADNFDLDEDGDTSEPLPIDLDFLPRVVGANVDMGVFEFQGAPCRADIDGNGAVDVDDLVTVILEWGACMPGNTCPADLDLNMQVDVDDLLAVILGWGACP